MSKIIQVVIEHFSRAKTFFLFAEICIATDHESEIDLQVGRFFPSLTVIIIKQGRFSLTLFKGTCLDVKSASTKGPGRGGTSHLTDFDETWPV